VRKLEFKKKRKVPYAHTHTHTYTRARAKFRNGSTVKSFVSWGATYTVFGNHCIGSSF